MEWDRSSLPFRSAGRRSLASWSLLFGRDGAQLGGLRLVHRAVVVDRDAIVASCRLGRNEALAHIVGHCGDRTPARIAQPAAARHGDDDAVLLRHGLLAHAAQLRARVERYPAGHAILAAVAAARRMVDAVVIGRDGERRIVERADFHDLAQPAAELAGAARILTVL